MSKAGGGESAMTKEAVIDGFRFTPYLSLYVVHT